MKYSDNVFSHGEISLNYRVYTPEKTADPPLLVYLHGAGERGDTPDKLDHVLRHGIPKLINEGRRLPAVVLCPQCPTNAVWDNIVFAVKALIDTVAKEYGILSDRILLTGSSMGGYGSFALALAYPTLFAAIAPISGGNMSWRASNLKTTPVYAVHGACDTLVPPVCSQLMVDAVNATGGNAELLLLDGMGHNDAIDYAYRHAGVIEWLLPKRRTDFSPVPEFCNECF